MLLEAVYRSNGYDFRNYAVSSLQRRITHRMNAENVNTISELQGLILYDRSVMQRFVQDLSINVTEMFRDPDFFQVVRSKVIPLIQDKPKIRIWHAGCSSGEEVYSMAILLHEVGLYEKTTIYGTDMNEDIVNKASEGRFPFNKMRKYTKNYLKAGGTKEFSGYYTANGHDVSIQPFLKKNILFATHNLATDYSFNEFDLIFCRNVLIYFNHELKNRVYKLFYQSLSSDGLVCFGNKESLVSSQTTELFNEFDLKNNIYYKLTQQDKK